MTRSLLLAVALLVVVAATDFASVPFKDCNSIFPVSALEASECTLTPVEVKGETKQLCSFKAGSNPTIRIRFTPNEEGVDGLETGVRAKFGKSTLPYSMADFESCKHGGLTCPLAKDVEAKFEQTFHVDPSYPQGELFQVNWSLAKGDKKYVCTVFLARIEA